MGWPAEGPCCPSWASPGRQSAWQAALLAAAVLSSGFLLAQAQAQEIPVTVEPASPLEGQDVTLTPGGKPTFILCDWFRGEQAETSRIFTYIPSTSAPVQQNGPGFIGRETGGPGCSLHIRSLMLNDTRDYVVTKTMMDGRETGRAHIEVLAPPLDPDPGLSAGAIVGIVIGCLLGVILIGVVVYFALKSTAMGRMAQHSSNGNIPSAPGHNQGVTDTKPTAGEEDIQYTTLAFNSSSPPQPSPGPTIPLESGTIYSVIKKK